MDGQLIKDQDTHLQTIIGFDRYTGAEKSAFMQDLLKFRKYCITQSAFDGVKGISGCNYGDEINHIKEMFANHPNRYQEEHVARFAKQIVESAMYHQVA